MEKIQKLSRRVTEVLSKPFDRNANESGMSLIEIILVISLMATIMAVLVRNLTGRQEEALKDTAKLGMQQLMQNLQEYKIHNYRYPATDQGLNALVENPGSKRWRGPYVEKEKLNDPWDTPYGYESDGRNVKIISAGPDAQQGTEDDITFPETAEGDAP